MQDISITKTISYKMEPTRQSTIDPIKTSKVDAARIQSKAYREYTYIGETTVPDKILLFNQSGLGGKEDCELAVKDLWKADTLPEEIIPTGKAGGDKVSPAPLERNNFAVSPTQTIGIHYNLSQKKEREEQKSNRLSIKTVAKQNKHSLANDDNNESNTSYGYKCPHPNCARTFIYKEWLNKHEAEGNHQMGSAFSSCSSNRPVHNDAHLTLNDIAINIFKNKAEFVGSTISVPILDGRPSNVSLEQNSLFKAGFATRTPLHHPKISKEILTCIEYLFNHGEKENNCKFQPADVRSYLQKAGTERFESEFGDNSIFTDYYNTTGGSKPIFHAALIPEEYRIKLAMGTINTIIKSKRKDAALPKLPTEMLRAQMMLSLQKDPELAKDPDNHIVIVDALLSIKVGSDIPISKIKAKTLSKLPNAVTPWSMPQRKAIVKAIKIVHETNNDNISIVELNDQVLSADADAENEDVIITEYQREIGLTSNENEEQEIEEDAVKVSQDAANELDDLSDDEDI